jgi:hypothetical protein
LPREKTSYNQCEREDQREKAKHTKKISLITSLPVITLFSFELMLLERAEQPQDVNDGELKKSLRKFAGSGDVEAITALFEAFPDLDINMTSKGKNNALHSALSHNQQGFIIDYLIKQGADIHAFNTKGFNPLILAIIHCQRNGIRALEKLISAGVDCTSTFMRGKFSGLTPLDLAVQFNNKQAATKLLEQIHWKKRHTSIDEEKVNPLKVHTKKKNHSTCPLCQCSVKFPTKLSYVLNDQDQAEKKERERSITWQDEVIQTNQHQPTKELYTSRKYLDQFLSHAGGSAFEKLCKIEYHGIGNKNKLRKEISESYSILHAVQQCCLDLGISDRIENNPIVHLEQVFLIDLCSGKSLTTALCGALFPSEPSAPGYGNNHFLAVDQLPVHLIPHFLQDDNSTYLSRDIMIPEFLVALEQEVHRQTAGGRTAILVGMHLCGNLSERAIELFQRIPLIKALILSPCCLPKLRSGITDFDSFQKHEEEDMYIAWSRYLEEKMDENSQKANLTVERYFDKEMHSIKNAIITGVKREE